MPAILGRKKKCRQCRQIWARKNSGKLGPEKKMPVFAGGDEIAAKRAIAGELTGLNNVK